MNVSDYVRRSILERAHMPIVDPQEMLTELATLRAVNERMRGQLLNRETSGEWLMAEVERLKAAVTDLGALHTLDYVEIERLRAGLRAAEDALSRCSLRDSCGHIKDALSSVRAVCQT